MTDVLKTCNSLSRDVLDYLTEKIMSRREEERIDYKSSIDLGNEEGKVELAKDISAIANTPGSGSGYILIGLIDPDKIKEDVDIFCGYHCDSIDQFWGQVSQALSKYLDVPPRIACHEILTSSDKNIVVIEVFQSYNRPHSVKRSSGDFVENQVWIRRGPHSFNANTNEIKEMLQGVRSWIVINFSTHPFTDVHKEQIRCMGYGIVDQVIEVPMQLDNLQSFDMQVKQFVGSVGLTMHQWKSMPILILLPGFAPAAGVLLALLHGMRGHFLSFIRMKPAGGLFEVAEVVDLHLIREDGRLARVGGFNLP